MMMVEAEVVAVMVGARHDMVGLHVALMMRVVVVVGEVVVVEVEMAAIGSVRAVVMITVVVGVASLMLLLWGNWPSYWKRSLWRRRRIRRSPEGYHLAVTSLAAGKVQKVETVVPVASVSVTACVSVGNGCDPFGFWRQLLSSRWWRRRTLGWWWWKLHCSVKLGSRSTWKRRG